MVDPVPKPDPQPVPQEAYLEFSGATMRAVAAVTTECVHPWLDSDGPDQVEFTLNALVMDGAVADIELLTFIEDLPDDVLECIRDVAWNSDWPEFEVTGEVRFQRRVHARRRSIFGDDH